MPKVKLSGPQLFLRYAGLYCAFARYASGQITFEGYQKIESLLKTGEPKIPFLKECFPDGVIGYEQCCVKKKIVCDWSFKSVADYWRHNHGRFGECAVHISTISFIANEIILVGLPYPVTNPYKIPLKIDDVVTVHHRIVVEKLEKSATLG